MKDDKEAIAAWKLELSRILHVFNVCYFAPMRPLLTFRSKTELGMSARATASDTRQDPANEPTDVPDTRRNKSKSCAVGNQNRPVSTANALFIAE